MIWRSESMRAKAIRWAALKSALLTSWGRPRKFNSCATVGQEIKWRLNIGVTWICIKTWVLWWLDTILHKLCHVVMFCSGPQADLTLHLPAQIFLFSWTNTFIYSLKCALLFPNKLARDDLKSVGGGGMRQDWLLNKGYDKTKLYSEQQKSSDLTCWSHNPLCCVPGLHVFWLKAYLVY